MDIRSCFCWLTMFLLWPITTSSPNVKRNCQETCGNINISVPYPFGIGDPNCALSEDFLLNCSTPVDGPTELLFGANMWVTNTSVTDGTITVSIYMAFDCYDKSGNQNYSFKQLIDLGSSGLFTFSASQNKFTAIGCDTNAMVYNQEITYGASCFSFCDESVRLDKSSCSGLGCCQTSIPKNLKSLNILSKSFYNHTNVSYFNPCGFAFLAEEHSFEVSDWKLSDYPTNTSKSNVVIEWVVKNETCVDAQANESAYACGDNTDCFDSKSGGGYRCLCKDGYQGNPYRPLGCEDINECKDPQKYPCKGKCKNTIGNYTCQCPLGMRGDGKTGCEISRVTLIAAGIVAIIFLVIVCPLLYMICMKRRKENNFRKNGGMILKHQRLRIFTDVELTKATKNYDSSMFLGQGGFGSVYKGILQDKILVAVKKPKELQKAEINKECESEICIVSQVNHKNVVKLLGICLETKMPLLVYEFIPNGTLYQHIHENKSPILQTWKNRLRVALEIALALDYLHSLASPPIIHGDIKSLNILLDENYTAKVSDFGASVLISPGQRDIIATKIQGTLGYLDPEYLMTGILTEMSDVYSFGVLLVELLTGQKPNCPVRGGEKKNIIEYFSSSLESNQLEQILGFSVMDEGEIEEIEEFAEIANRCVNRSGMRRPSMKDVAEELVRLTKWHENSKSHQNSEETEHLLGESSYPTANIKNARSGLPDTINVAAFSVEYPFDSI